MKRGRLMGRTLGSTVCLIGVLAVGSIPLVASAKSNGLLLDATSASGVRLPAQALPSRSKTVRVDRGVLRQGRVSISLPGGIELKAVRDQRHDLGGGRSAWVGHANGKRANRVVLGVSGDAVAGTFAYGDRLYKLEPRADGSHVISEVLPTDPAPSLDPLPVTSYSNRGAPAAGTAQADGTTIDVLVAYTTDVQARYGTQGAQALAVQAVAETNQAYANSGIDARINLVHTAVTNYVEAGSMYTDLNRLTSKSDGYMDELHALRDTYGADMVSLIVDEPSSCGIAWLMSNLSSGFASSAFSVVHHSCATGYYSFGHELGHNQGAHHDPANAGGAMYPYAYGHQATQAGYRTVMAYNCPGGCSRVDHFSNPEVWYNGVRTGVVGVADNRQTINNNAATIANFRQSQAQPEAPDAPGGLQAQTAGQTAVDLEWQDNANDESGVIVERKTTGGSYSQVATLPANTEEYRDNGLQSDTLYFYRVKAWNSTGESGYSNEALASTEASSSSQTEGIFVASSEISVGGEVEGTYLDTWEGDNNTQYIGEQQSGGSAGISYSYLEHKWVFQIEAGTWVRLIAKLNSSPGNESYTFAYSLDGVNYTNLSTIGSGVSGSQQMALPALPAGTVYVRVRDNVRQPGTETSHSLEVDRLMIISVEDVVGC